MLRKMFFVLSREWDKEKLIKLYGETIQMKAIEQFFSSCVSVYQAVHRGFNLKSLDKLWCATT